MVHLKLLPHGKEVSMITGMPVGAAVQSHSQKLINTSTIIKKQINKTFTFDFWLSSN